MCTNHINEIALGKMRRCLPVEVVFYSDINLLTFSRNKIFIIFFCQQALEIHSLKDDRYCESFKYTISKFTFIFTVCPYSVHHQMHGCELSWKFTCIFLDWSRASLHYSHFSLLITSRDVLWGTSTFWPQKSLINNVNRELINRKIHKWEKQPKQLKKKLKKSGLIRKPEFSCQVLLNCYGLFS